MDISLVIMAAGMGSRYKGLKQLDDVGPAGETLLDYSIHDAFSVGFNRIVLVIRREHFSLCKKTIEDKWRGKMQQIFFAFQENKNITYPKANAERSKPWGTTHAMLSAKSFIQGPFAVINADDFYGLESFKKMYQYLSGIHDSLEEEGAMVSYLLENTLSDFGSVNRGVCKVVNGRLDQIAEVKNIAKDEHIFANDHTGRKNILAPATPVSMNFWGFSRQIIPKFEQLFRQFLDRFGDDETRECLIPELINDLISKQIIKIKVMKTNEKWFGLTHPEDKKLVMKNLSSLPDPFGSMKENETFTNI